MNDWNLEEEFNHREELRGIAREELKPADRFDLAKAMWKAGAGADAVANYHRVARDPQAPMYLRVWALEEIKKAVAKPCAS